MQTNKNRKLNFTYLEKVLQRQPTERPVMFDFIIGEQKERMLVGNEYKNATEFDRVITNFKAFENAGYDHASIVVRGLEFVRKGHSQKDALTKSLNEGTLITDKESFDAYEWPEIENCDFSIIDRAGQYLKDGVKMVPFSLDGILENTIGVLGYENLCYLLYDDTQIVEDVFYNVGSRIKQYFAKCLEYDQVGAILCNDDWGFNSQTMLSPELLRKYVFPWYTEIVEMAHKKGKFAILHSCGCYTSIIDDVIDNIKFDGRHSYEDNIIPVEKAYDQLHNRIAVLGGMDVDFLARATSEQIYNRCKQMLQKSKTQGGYALGSGNSIPDYISNDNYLALLKAANEEY